MEKGFCELEGLQKPFFFTLFFLYLSTVAES